VQIIDFENLGQLSSRRIRFWTTSAPPLSVFSIRCACVRACVRVSILDTMCVCVYVCVRACVRWCALECFLYFPYLRVFVFPPPFVLLLSQTRQAYLYNNVSCAKPVLVNDPLAEFNQANARDAAPMVQFFRINVYVAVAVVGAVCVRAHVYVGRTHACTRKTMILRRLSLLVPRRTPPPTP